MELKALGWEIREEIKNKKEVKFVIEGIEKRVIEICKKFAKGNVNYASLPAFWLAIQGDIDNALIKANKRNKNG